MRANIPVVNNEDGENKLVRVEPERSKAEGKYEYPEIDQVWRS
jgi:hypothetical protein